jgi:hypothetical protein
MTTPKEFMLLFRFEPNHEYQPSEADLAEQHQAWGAYVGSLAAQEKFVSTSQLGFEGMLVQADHSTSEGIHIADRQTLGGNMIVKASSMAEATEIAKGCPILMMGGNVEVREILPM